jgi:hypothetical protein
MERSLPLQIGRLIPPTCARQAIDAQPVLHSFLRPKGRYGPKSRRPS